MDLSPFGAFPNGIIILKLQMEPKSIQKYLLLILLSGLMIQPYLFGQISKRESHRLNNIFNKIERSINNGDVQGMSKYFSSRVFVSIPKNINNFFSNNHLYYLLKDYFAKHRAMYFAFDKVSISQSNPFGYGSFTYQHNGERKRSTIYIAFSKIGNAWRITKITVN